MTGVLTVHRRPSCRPVHPLRTVHPDAHSDAYQCYTPDTNHATAKSAMVASHNLPNRTTLSLQNE